MIVGASSEDEATQLSWEPLLCKDENISTRCVWQKNMGRVRLHQVPAGRGRDKRGRGDRGGEGMEREGGGKGMEGGGGGGLVEEDV